MDPPKSTPLLQWETQGPRGDRFASVRGSGIYPCAMPATISFSIVAALRFSKPVHPYNLLNGLQALRAYILSTTPLEPQLVL